MQNIKTNCVKSLVNFFKFHPLLSLLIAGTILRAILFNLVIVSYDTGLYLHDAMMIMKGGEPLVDYPSRSPLFHLLLSIPLSLDVSPILTGRVFMIFGSMLLATSIFYLTNHLYNRRAAIIATAIFLLTPFSAIYGLWVKTEQWCEFFAIIGFSVLIPHIDSKKIGYQYPLASGLILGAAFLIRRVAIVHVAALLLFLLYYRFWYRKHPIFNTALNGILTLIGVVGSLGIGYTILGWPSIKNILYLFKHHSMWFIVGGAGSMWLKLANSEISEGGVTVGTLNLNVFLVISILIIALPAVLPLLIYIRSYLEQQKFPNWVSTLFAGLSIICIIGGSGFIFSIYVKEVAHLILVFFTSATVIAGVLFIWYVRVPDMRTLWTPRLMLPTLLLLFLALSYIIRNKNIHITYFQDFYPFVAIMAGSALSKLIEINKGNKQIFKYGAVILIVATFVSFVFSPPFLPTYSLIYNNHENISPTELLAIGNNLNGITEPEDQIFTAQPLYVLEANRELVVELSRKYWLLVHYPDSEFSQNIERNILEAIKNGSVSHVIVEKRTKEIFKKYPAIEEAVKSNYCPIKNELYDKVGATLYVKSEAAPKCSSNTPMSAQP